MGFNRPENWKETTIYFVVPSISCLTTSIVIAILNRRQESRTANKGLPNIAGVVVYQSVVLLIIFVAA